MRRRRFLQVVGTGVAGAAFAGSSAWGQGGGGVVELDGVPALAFRTGRECTFIGCLEAVLRYHGEAYDYVDLMGLSGAAFRVRIAYPTTDRIMGGRIHPGISTDASFGPHIAAIEETTGYRLGLEGHFLHGDRGVEVAASAIEAELDESRPVLAMNLMGGSRWGVIAGYDADVSPTDAAGEEQGKRYLCRTYYDPPGADYQPALHLPWDLYTVTPGGEAAPAEAALTDSVGRAVNLLEAETGTVQRPSGWMWFFKPEYANGLHAYDAWIEDLQAEEAIGALTPDQFVMYWQGHACMYDQLHDARRAAAAYLRRSAPKLADRQAALLREVASMYDDFVSHMTMSWECFPFREGGYVEPETGWRLGVETEELLGRRVPAYAAEWTSDMRRAGCDILRALQEKEAEALAALHACLEG